MERPPATRMHLLTLRSRIATAVKALDLLSAKRKAIMQAFYETVPRALEARRQLDAATQVAAEALDQTLSWQGPEALRAAALGSGRTVDVEVTERSLWGTRYPELNAPLLVRESNRRGYDAAFESSMVDETALAFERVAEQLVRTANHETRLRVLGEELRKLSRRVRALEDRLLPQLRLHMRQVLDALEEREREDVLRLKYLKSHSGPPRNNFDTAAPLSDLFRDSHFP